jgi:hypothetical protein
MPAVFIHGVSVRKQRFDALVAQVGRELGERVEGLAVSGAYWGDHGSSLRFGGASIPGVADGTRGALSPAKGTEPVVLADLLVEEPLLELEANAHRPVAGTGFAAAVAAVPREVEVRNQALRGAVPALVDALAAVQADYVEQDKRAGAKKLQALVDRTIEAAAATEYLLTATALVDPVARALASGMVVETIGEPTLGAAFPWTQVESAIHASVEQGSAAVAASEEKRPNISPPGCCAPVAAGSGSCRRTASSSVTWSST